MERGYDTSHELGIISRIKSPQKHNLLQLYDFANSQELKDLGFSGVISVVEHFPSKTLGIL